MDIFLRSSFSKKLNIFFQLQLHLSIQISTALIRIPNQYGKKLTTFSYNGSKNIPKKKISPRVTSLARETVPFNKHICAKLMSIYYETE